MSTRALALTLLLLPGCARAETWVHHVNRANSPPRCGQTSIVDKIVPYALEWKRGTYPLAVGTCARSGFPIRGGTGTAAKLPATTYYGSSGKKRVKIQLYYASASPSTGNETSTTGNNEETSTINTYAPKGSMCAKAASVVDFSSQQKMQAGGWRFSPDTWRTAHDSWCGQYSGQASTYCGYQYNHRKQAIMLTLSGSGSATVTYRNNYHGRDCSGSVVLYLGNRKLSSAANYQAQATTFRYNAGDVMTLQDEGCTVILLTDVSFSSCSAPGSTGVSGAMSEADGRAISEVDNAVAHGSSVASSDDGDESTISTANFIVPIGAVLLAALLTIGAFVTRQLSKRHDVVSVVGAVEVAPLAEVQALQGVELDGSAVTVQGTTLASEAVPHSSTYKATAVHLESGEGNMSAAAYWV